MLSLPLFWYCPPCLLLFPLCLPLHVVYYCPVTPGCVVLLLLLSCHCPPWMPLAVSVAYPSFFVLSSLCSTTVMLLFFFTVPAHAPAPFCHQCQSSMPLHCPFVAHCADIALVLALPSMPVYASAPPLSQLTVCMVCPCPFPPWSIVLPLHLC